MIMNKGIVRRLCRNELCGVVTRYLRVVSIVITSVYFFAACSSFRTENYASIYIRALERDGLTDVGAKVYLGDTGQVLTTELTPTEVVIDKNDGWQYGQIIPLVLDAPGYRAAIHLMIVSRWASSRDSASQNSNNVDVVMVRD